MRNKLLLVLGLFVVLSGGSAFAQISQTHDVETTLTEIRNITLGGGNISLALKRSAVGDWVSDTSSTLIAEHDLLAPQKITVHTENPTAWAARYLRLNPPVMPAIGWTTAAVAAAPILLIDNGLEMFPAGTPTDLITALKATTTDGVVAGPTPPLSFGFSARADIAALLNIDDTVSVVYTITDN